MHDVRSTNAEEFDMAKKTENNQPVIEDNAEASPEALEPAPIVEPELSAVDSLSIELAHSKDKCLRLAAEFENYKKIAQREQQNSIKFANESIIVSLLPVIDNLEQAIVACKKPGEENNNVLLGVEMVHKQFIDVLSKYGVEMFSALNQPFDPARHEALGEQESLETPAGTVILEYQKGYLFHGRLLRAARVVIARQPKS